MKGHGCCIIVHGAWLGTYYRVYQNLPAIPLYDEAGDYTSEAKIMQRQFDQWGHVDWPDELADRQSTLRRRWNVGDYWNDPLALVEKMRRQYP